MKRIDMQRIKKNDLMAPLVAVMGGVAYLVAGIVGGQTGFGVAGFVLMVAVAVAFWLLRGRSETVKGLIDHGDERINAMDLKATAFAGVAVIVAVLVAFVVDIARGNDGAPFFWLAGIGAVAYILVLVVQRVRG